MNSAADTWLVVGLGNPGTPYEATRHNAGARTVEALARKVGWKLKAAKRAPAFVGEGRIGGAQVLLARPKTYMNDSGRAVASLMHSRAIAPENLIVVHDDIDLTPGSLKLKFGGGAAGQRGVESVIRSVGTKDFYRVRVGVGRGPSFQKPSKFVLERIPKDAIEHHLEQETRAADAVVTLIEDGLPAAQNKFNFIAEPEF